MVLYGWMLAPFSGLGVLALVRDRFLGLVVCNQCRIGAASVGGTLSNCISDGVHRLVTGSVSPVLSV